MTKRFGKTESYRIKQLIFSLIAIIIIVLIITVVFFREALVLYVFAGFLTLITVFLVTRYDFLITLKEFERAVIFKFGKFSRVGGPGWTLIIPLIETFKIVDLRTQTIDVPKQEVITKGNIELKIDAVIYLYVNKDAESVKKSVIEVENYKEAARFFVVATIRDVLGSLSLSEITTGIENINQKLKAELQGMAQEWGVSVESVQIKDVDIPKTVLDAMHLEKAAEQHKLRRIELAQAHKAEIEAVKEAAESLSDKALGYYYIRALERLGRTKSTKFFFPIELSRLAESLSGVKSESKIEDLLEKYAPLLQKYFEEKIPEKARGKKKKK